MNKKILLFGAGNINIYLIYEDMELIAEGLGGRELARSVIKYGASLQDVEKAMKLMMEEVL